MPPALNAAKRLTDTHDVEVWDGGRLVARLSPGGEGASPGLAPRLVFARSSDGEMNPVSRAEPDPVSMVLDLVTSILRESFRIILKKFLADSGHSIEYTRKTQWTPILRAV